MDGDIEGVLDLKTICFHMVEILGWKSVTLG